MCVCLQCMYAFLLLISSQIARFSEYCSSGYITATIALLIIGTVLCVYTLGAKQELDICIQ